MIHEFDPYFNFRSTQVLVNDGFYAFHNWFDSLVLDPPTYPPKIKKEINKKNAFPQLFIQLVSFP